MKRKLQGKPVSLSFMDSGMGRSLCPGFIVLFLKSFVVVCVFKSMSLATGTIINNMMDILVRDLLGGVR